MVIAPLQPTMVIALQGQTMVIAPLGTKSPTCLPPRELQGLCPPPHGTCMPPIHFVENKFLLTATPDAVVLAMHTLCGTLGQEIALKAARAVMPTGCVTTGATSQTLMHCRLF